MSLWLADGLCEQFAPLSLVDHVIVKQELHVSVKTTEILEQRLLTEVLFMHREDLPVHEPLLGEQLAATHLGQHSTNSNYLWKMVYYSYQSLRRGQDTDLIIVLLAIAIQDIYFCLELT